MRDPSSASVVDQSLEIVHQEAFCTEYDLVEVDMRDYEPKVLEDWRFDSFGLFGLVGAGEWTKLLVVDDR